MSSTSISELPEEMLRMILRMLPPSGLKAVMLVCKQWKSHVDDPKLWTWSVVSVNTRKDLKKLQIHRLQLIQNIRLCRSGSDNTIDGIWNQPEDLTSLLQVVLDTPSITMLYGIESYNFGSVEPSLLGSALGKLDVLKPLHLFGNLSTSQVEHLFTAIAKRESPMKELTVVGWFMTELSPTLFASAVSNVKKLKLAGFSTDQMLALVQEVAENERPLAKLDLSCCRIINIDPDLVGKALNKLEAVTFASCRYGWVSHELVTATLRGVLGDGSKLKKLMLNDISSSFAKGLDRELLEQTLKKIGKFWSKPRKTSGSIQLVNAED